MLSKLTDPGAVKSAIAEFNGVGREAFLKKYKYGSSREYRLLHEGRLYDSKPILGAAFGYQFPKRGPLTFDKFGGGELTVARALNRLGFEAIRIPQSNLHFLLKLNRDQVPNTGNKRDWASQSFKIEPVRLTRAGSLIDPVPPPLIPGSTVAIWVNDGGDLGGIVAIATVDDVSRVGTQCRLGNIRFCQRIGLAGLSSSRSHLLQDLYQDVESNRRSKVRHLLRPQWSELKKLIESRGVADVSVSLVREMADRIHEKAHDFRIGSLQAIRARIRGKRRAGSAIFSPKSVKETYAFHSGGRDELQFNIGEEATDRGDRFRWGVAFSFKPSRTLPDPGILARNVRFFNDYMSLYGDDFADMTMWKYAGDDGPIDIGAPRAIDVGLVRSNVFVFLGKRAPRGDADARIILRDFDRLLPLYEYVQSNAAVVPERPKAAFVFKPGHREKVRRTTASIVERELEMDLRHGAIQKALFRLLAKEHGEDVVATEHQNPFGMRIDGLLKRGTRYWLYEVKTSSSPRTCLREALGQLLEYSLWPGGIQAERLIVVGESPLDAEAENYLATLNGKLSIPVEYLAVRAADD